MDKPLLDASRADMINIYSIYVQGVLANEHKRQQATQFYLAIISALIAAAATMRGISLDVAAAVVMVIAVFWHLTIRYHRTLAAVKFTVIGEMEDALPYRPYAREWEIYKARRDGPGFLSGMELTRLEGVVPWFFFLAAVVLLIVRNIDSLSATS